MDKYFKQAVWLWFVLNINAKEASSHPSSASRMLSYVTSGLASKLACELPSYHQYVSLTHSTPVKRNKRNDTVENTRHICAECVHRAQALMGITLPTLAG